MKTPFPTPRPLTCPARLRPGKRERIKVEATKGFVPGAIRIVITAVLLASLPGHSRATTYTWLGTSGNAWSINANWQGGVAPPSDLVNTDLIFTNSGGPDPSISGPYSIHSLTFTSNANAFSFDTGPLTLGAGGFTQNAANAEAFGAPVILGAAQTWTLGSGAGALTFGNGVNTTSGSTSYTLTINAATTTGSGNVLNGAITGGGSLTKTGAGTLTLTGASTYSGDTNVNAGTLSVVSGGSVSGRNVNVNAGGTLAISGSGSVSTPLSLGGSLVVDGTAASPASLTLGDSGTLSTAFALIGVNGQGAVTQTGGSFTTNGLDVDLGVNAGSSGSFTLGGTGRLSTSGGNLYVGEGGSGTFTQNGGTLVTARTIVGNATAAVGTFTQNGGVHTTGQLIVGSSSATAGPDTYNLNGGTLQPGGVSGAGSSPGTFNFQGGTLQATANSTSFFQGLGTANVRGSAATANSGAVIDTQGFNVTVAQDLTHSAVSGDNATDGGLTKLGTGTLTLGGANTFTGVTTISAGTLDLDNANALGGSTLTVSLRVPLLAYGRGTRCFRSRHRGRRRRFRAGWRDRFGGRVSLKLLQTCQHFAVQIFRPWDGASFQLLGEKPQILGRGDPLLVKRLQFQDSFVYQWSHRHKLRSGH